MMTDNEFKARQGRKRIRDDAARAALPALIALYCETHDIEEITKLAYMFGEGMAQRRDSLVANEVNHG
jgi:hypothetical protein